MRRNFPVAGLFLLFLLIFSTASNARAGGGEFVGAFSKDLVPNLEDYERVVFKFDSGEQWRSLGQFGTSTHFAAGRLMNPQTGQYSLVALIVEDGDKPPVVFADVNEDHRLSADEKFELKEEKEDNPYLWNATIPIAFRGGFFTNSQIFVRYYRSYKTDNMGPEDRLITQTTQVMARGSVDVGGRIILVQFAIPQGENKVDAQSGWLGMDTDGDGQIDMDGLSYEAAQADKEAVVFRVGDRYFSTKKADVAKNQIVLKENSAKDYKRVELSIGKQFPDFGFTDFGGKKRRLSEFRGKYVLLDIWGFWCGPCRKELPYLREARKRFGSRNLELVGLNTDTDFTVDSMNDSLKKNDMSWTHAQFSSVQDFLRVQLRVNSFPTTFLISPDGSILSMSRSDRDEPSLRGDDLLKSLDKLLPKAGTN